MSESTRCTETGIGPGVDVLDGVDEPVDVIVGVVTATPDGLGEPVDVIELVIVEVDAAVVEGDGDTEDDMEMEDVAECVCDDDDVADDVGVRVGVWDGVLEPVGVLDGVTDDVGV